MKNSALKLAFCLLISLFAVVSHAADAESYAPGIDYAVIDPAVPTHVAPGKVEVVEMFWYGCPHCFHFEPYLQKWLADKPDYVAFRHIPAVFRDNVWALHARAFYTAKLLGIGEKIHEPLFNAIHKQHKQLDTKQELAAFFGKFGIKRQQFDDTFDSFTVAADVAHSKELSRSYGLDGVPTIVVDGKYRISGEMAGTYDRMLKIIDYLVQREHKRMSGK